MGFNLSIYLSNMSLKLQFNTHCITRMSAVVVTILYMSGYGDMLYLLNNVLMICKSIA